jgi:putative ATP-dependent endonuclease of the OLD family
MNAFIGPNNSGKSNILSALNLVLGESWPTKPFDDADYHKYDKTSPIEIVIYFDVPLAIDPDVHGFRLAEDQNGVSFRPVDANGQICVTQWNREKFINNQMRSEVALLYLGLDRQADKQLRPSQWTLYGKLLKAKAVPPSCARRAGALRPTSPRLSTDPLNHYPLTTYP